MNDSMKSDSRRYLEKVLTKAYQGLNLTDEEIIFLLGMDDSGLRKTLFNAAAELRNKYFGPKIFLYGFLYTSTYCRNDCRFCFYRRSNRASRRYRKTDAQVLEAARRLAATGIHLIDLTMGEDPLYYQGGPAGFEGLVRLARQIKEETGLPVMASPGAIPDQVLYMLAGAGVTWYACYHETHQRALFKQLRPGQSYDNRMSKKKLAHQLGLLVEEGILSGVGESQQDIAESISAMRRMDADQVRVMRFVPHRGIPMKNSSTDPDRESLILAILRLAFPDRLIPASLDIDGLAGLKQRLQAGANVVTSLVPSGRGFCGVAQSSMDIDEGNRSSACVRSVLEECGLSASSNGEYQSWIRARKDKIACGQQ